MSASEALQNLLAGSAADGKESPANKWDRRINEEIPVNELTEIPPARKTSSDSSTSNKSTTYPSQTTADNESAGLLTDPLRFPACAKLIELTKARSSQHLSPTERPPSKRSLSARNLYANNELSSHSNMQSSILVGTTSASPVNSSRLHKKRFTEDDDRALKGTLDNDDITIVIPSSDQTHPWHHGGYQSRSGNSEKVQDSVFSSPNHRYSPCTPNQTEAFDQESGLNSHYVNVTQTDYCYSLASLPSSHSTTKKIKIENMYE